MDLRSKNRHKEHLLEDTKRLSTLQPGKTMHICLKCEWLGWVEPKPVEEKCRIPDVSAEGIWLEPDSSVRFTLGHYFERKMFMDLLRDKYPEVHICRRDHGDRKILAWSASGNCVFDDHPDDKPAFTFPNNLDGEGSVMLPDLEERENKEYQTAYQGFKDKLQQYYPLVHMCIDVDEEHDWLRWSATGRCPSAGR